MDKVGDYWSFPRFIKLIITSKLYRTIAATYGLIEQLLFYNTAPLWPQYYVVCCVEKGQCWRMLIIVVSAIHKTHGHLKTASPRNCLTAQHHYGHTTYVIMLTLCRNISIMYDNRFRDSNRFLSSEVKIANLTMNLL